MEKKKVLIVDDEFYIRNGLAKMVCWEELGYSIIGFASDGSTALESCQKELPDIVFTDIMMPIVDGLELTKQLAEKWPSIVVIILSSYNDLQYVKTALKNGASEYILKPSINPETIKQLLLSVCPPKQQFQTTFQSTHKEIPKTASLEELTYFYPFFIGFLIGENNFFHIQEVKEVLETLLDNTAYQMELFKFANNYFILINHSQENLKSQPITLPTPCIFFSNTANLSWLNQQIETALLFYSDFPYYFSGSLFSWQPTTTVIQPDQLLTKEKELLTLIKTERFAEAITLLKSLTSSEVFFVKSDLHNFFNASIISFLSKLEDSLNCSMGMKKIEFLTICNQEPTQAKTLQKIATFLEILQQEYLTTNEEEPIKKQILSYIQQHYTEGINLASIADQFHFNYNYLSRSFAHLTGQTFTDYLNSLRIKEAKKLLKQSELSIAEVSQQVGYTDTSYFSKVFKKMTKCSPSTYRRKQPYD